MTCLGVQFFHQHGSYTFFNAFTTPDNYVEIKDKSILNHMKDTSQYDEFGNRVIVAFTFVLFMILQECFWLAMLTKGDEQLVKMPGRESCF